MAEGCPNVVRAADSVTENGKEENRLTLWAIHRIFDDWKIMTEAAVHIVVGGAVQGVGFRYFVYQRARRLGITGIVRNLGNGNVEIEAEGERSLLEELIREVNVGSRASRVAGVVVEWRAPAHRASEFIIQ